MKVSETKNRNTYVTPETNTVFFPTVEKVHTKSATTMKVFLQFQKQMCEKHETKSLTLSSQEQDHLISPSITIVQRIGWEEKFSLFS